MTNERQKQTSVAGIYDISRTMMPLVIQPAGDLIVPRLLKKERRESLGLYQRNQRL